MYKMISAIHIFDFIHFLFVDLSPSRQERQEKKLGDLAFLAVLRLG
jgi:hypothetical protein